MFKLQKIIRVSHTIACPIVFILFHKKSWQGSVVKTMKIDHFSVFNRLGTFKFLERLRSSLY